LQTHISEIQENHLQHLEIQNDEQNKIVLNALRYNPAILAKAAHQVVIKLSETFHKVKANIQQVQNNRLSTELLKGDTINKIFKFIQNSASEILFTCHSAPRKHVTIVSIKSVSNFECS
jgi:hypothetical protein